MLSPAYIRGEWMTNFRMLEMSAELLISNTGFHSDP